MTCPDLPKSRILSSELPIKGLKRDYTLLHITDVHMTLIEETQSAQRKDTARDRGNVLFTEDGIPAHERFAAFFSYAEAIGADLILMTGDIIDMPSQKNIDFLKKMIRTSPVKTFYVVGNHDWSFLDAYHSPEAKRRYLPAFSDISGGDTSFHFLEFDDFILAGLDNSTDTFTKEQLARTKALFLKEKPLLLAVHVPISSPLLAQKSREIWNGRNLCLGSDGIRCEATDAFLKSVLHPSSPMAAVIAGHLHLCCQEEIAPGISQLVTSEGYNGTCRRITLKAIR